MILKHNFEFITVKTSSIIDFSLKKVLSPLRRWKLYKTGIYVADSPSDLRFLVSFWWRTLELTWIAMHFLSPGLIIQLTTALQLEGLVTKKPRLTKYTIKPQAVINILPCHARQQFSSFYFQPTLSPSSTSTYRVNATNGNTCILIQTDGLLTLQYRDKYGEDKEADVYLPDYPTISGWKNYQRNID